MGVKCLNFDEISKFLCIYVDKWGKIDEISNISLKIHECMWKIDEKLIKGEKVRSHPKITT